MITKALIAGMRQVVVIPVTLVIFAGASVAQSKLYSPIPLPATGAISDKLSEKDIPNGQGGFARDYVVKLNIGDNVVIDLTSDSFDAIVTLLGPDGSTIGENDDGPDGSTNSLLFARITKTGMYVVRVHAFGETGVGPFKLKVTRLRPI